MRNGTRATSWAAVVLASVGAHAVAFGGLGHGGWGADGAPARRRPATVEMTVAPPPTPAPPPASAPRPAAARPRIATARVAPRAHTSSRRAPVVAPPAAAETPADFTGQTLTNDGPGAAWSSATGNGERMSGPLGRPGARVTRRVVDGAPGGTGSGSPVVGLGDLARVPVAPDLSDALAAAYPPEARARGVEGKAIVKARITPEGRARDLTVVSETTPGFGAACEVTLRGSKWSPPVDQNGRAVSTVINYTCRFTVR
ncbi:MAG TPA: TonB family protein [Polyangia bacterium]